MAYGRISRLMRSAGYGFILEAGQSEELEFHWTAVTAGNLEQLTVGQQVEFDERIDHRAPSRIRAVNVRLMEKD
jgi:cold shock CspA family protein